MSSDALYERYKTVLADFLVLQSVSTDEAYKPEIQKTVAFLQELFDECEQAVTAIVEGKAVNPLVVSRIDVGAAKTLLIYGHYDVQPASMEQGWSSDPFTLAERDGRLYGRGVVDNKGQVLVHIIAALELAKAGTLAQNVVFVLEGNEETANPELSGILATQPELFACDAVLISDGGSIKERPALEASLRGGFNAEISLKTAKTDLHSGLAGGAVPSASHELIKLLDSLVDGRGKVLVDGFYDGMRAVPEDALRQNQALEVSEQPREMLGVKELISANGVDFYTQTGLYPTLQVTGVSSGYTGDGFANIVPATATAKLNVRIVGGQDPQAIYEALAAHLKSQVSDYAELTLAVDGIHEAVVLNLDTPAAATATQLLAEVYGADPITLYIGGAIPVVHDFQNVMGKPTLLIGLGNDDCNMHGADENFRIDLIHKGLAFSTRLLSMV